jgi:UDP-N-acetyl-D-glucosamine dehydrogenase
VSEFEQRLLQAIDGRAAIVSVAGLGYVGLPLALAFAEAGFQVLGFDLDTDKVESLNRGESYLREFGSDRVQTLVDSGELSATTDTGRFSEPDIVVICVPTPLAEDGSPDLRFVEATARSIRRQLKPGQLIVLESTTYPGTTEEVVQPILEESGLECGREFFLAYSPEREDPGNSRHSVGTIPKVVGGVGRASKRLAEALYQTVVPTTVAVSSTRVAEASKLTENIFRAVNIALVNELKIIFDSMDIDVWEVLDAAETKPFGFMRFDPGPGWGGHCIPIDPFYLAWKARQAGAQADFIELAGKINTMMPNFVVSKLEAALATRGKELSGARILVIGLAYKKNVADPRESPAFEMIDLIRQNGGSVDYHDPLISEAPSMRTWKELANLESKALTSEMLPTYDGVVVITDHDSIDYELIRNHSRLIIDTRGRYREPAENVVLA